MWSEIFCDVLFEPEERPPQSNKTQDASLPRDAVSALVFHICDIWKLWGADALSMSNDHLARELGLLHPPHQPPHVHEGRVGVLLGRCWDPPDGSGCAGRRVFFLFLIFIRLVLQSSTVAQSFPVKNWVESWTKLHR